MRLTESQLRKIIREEISTINEMFFPDDRNRSKSSNHVFHVGETVMPYAAETIADTIMKNPALFSSFIKKMKTKGLAEVSFDSIADFIIEIDGNDGHYSSGAGVTNFLNNNLTKRQVMVLKRSLVEEF